MRVAYAVYVNLDPQTGIMHTPESAAEVILVELLGRMPRYRPSVVVAKPGDVASSHVGNRVALIVETNLDDVPGIMHTQESAQHVIRNIMWQRVPNYNPLVSLAPAHLQPNKEEGLTNR